MRYSLFLLPLAAFLVSCSRAPIETTERNGVSLERYSDRICLVDRRSASMHVRYCDGKKNVPGIDMVTYYPPGLLGDQRMRFKVEADMDEERSWWDGATHYRYGSPQALELVAKADTAAAVFRGENFVPGGAAELLGSRR